MRAPFGETVTLKSDEFRLLRDLFAARAGLQFGPETRFALERRLRERLMVLKLSTFADYHRYLRFGVHATEEWDEAIDLLTTNETYFFREARQLRAFQNEILPMLEGHARMRRRLSIWSAGCSTGEEAYTIAILVHQSRLFSNRVTTRPPGDGAARDKSVLRDATGREVPWVVRVYGSDISRRCVASARRGVYAESSFRATPDDVRHAFSASGPTVGAPTRASARCVTSGR